jgi:hypothetical protein
MPNDNNEPLGVSPGWRLIAAANAVRLIQSTGRYMLSGFQLFIPHISKHQTLVSDQSGLVFRQSGQGNTNLR